jgi:hypothetical protein
LELKEEASPVERKRGSKIYISEIKAREGEEQRMDAERGRGRGIVMINKKTSFVFKRPNGCLSLSY